MTVSATADGERFGAALFYSRATANSTYRELAEICNAIL
jgi:hypothetical protein